MTEFQLNEVFDEEKASLPVTNLYPKTKIPQIFGITTPEGAVALRMCSYTGGGDVNKNVKPGDKLIHAIVLGMSDKGTLIKLKNLGGDPIGVISTMFDIVASTVKQYRMDAVMFRVAKSKIGGQAKTIQMILNRLVMSRLGGRYVILKELYDYDKKYVYVLIHRKNVDLSTIPGIPEISTELFTKVESKVGDVYINKDTGTQISKSEALAATIAIENDKRTDQGVIARSKVSRRAVAQSQSMDSDNLSDLYFQKYEETASEFSKPATAPEIPEAAELLLSIESKAQRESSAISGAKEILSQISYRFGIDPVKSAPKIVEEIKYRTGNARLTSVKSMQSFVQSALDILEEHKDIFIQKEIKVSPHFMNDKEKLENAEKRWNIRRVNYIKDCLQEYANNVSKGARDITATREPEQYSRAEKTGIKEYVGSGYTDINNMLLGRYKADDYDTLNETDVKRAIDNIDSAFKKGDKLPEGLTLWRAQSIRKPIYESLVKNKVFYFRNYVSTSLMPIIFGGWKGNAAVAMTSDNTQKVFNIDGDPESVNLKNIADKTVMNNPESIRVTVGWAIDGADKINVIFPGSISTHSGEMEIILPRGTMVKVNKITDASYNDGIDYTNQRFIQAEIMTSDQIEESVIYDGDVLMETGEVVEYDGEEDEGVGLDFDSFVKTKKVSESNKGLDILASLIDIDDIPPRFVN